MSQQKQKATSKIEPAVVKPIKTLAIFTSPTCGPCKRYKPELIAESEKRGIQLELAELSDENKQRFLDLGIRSVPVTILYVNGEEASRLQGAPVNVGHQLDQWGL